MQRTKETAIIIAKHYRADIVYSELFQEVGLPSAIMGKSNDDHEAIEIKKVIKEHYADDSWRHF